MKENIKGTVPTSHTDMISTYKRTIELYMETSRFIVKTAETPDELEQALRLRHEIFYQELSNNPREDGIDIDQFDMHYDHLIIMTKADRKIVATYRCTSTGKTTDLYSRTEFNIDALLELPGNILELGRACVKPEYRNGIMIMLLWKVIFLYCNLADCRYLMGCSSVLTTVPEEVGLAYSIFKKLYFTSDARRVYPLEHNRMENIEKYMVDVSERDDKELKTTLSSIIPPLFDGYLTLGNLVCGEPAIDREINCSDFIILLDSEDMSERNRRKYGFL